MNRYTGKVNAHHFSELRMHRQIFQYFGFFAFNLITFTTVKVKSIASKYLKMPKLFRVTVFLFLEMTPNFLRYATALSYTKMDCRSRLVRRRAMGVRRGVRHVILTIRFLLSTRYTFSNASILRYQYQFLPIQSRDN